MLFTHEDETMRRSAALLAVLLLTLPVGAAEGPCRSGPKAGQRPGPYAFVMCTGEQRGKSHCYICETADRPAVIVFARSLSEPLGKLAARLDKALADYKKNDLRAWVTLLHEDQSKIDPDVVKWAKKHAVRTVPVGVFEDPDGPPSYRLHRDADVTILLSVKQKVVANFAFRAGELSDKKLAEVLETIPKIAGPAKK
jgi:hypothetical protein